MTTKSGNRNLLVIIIVLVLTNIAVLGYFLWFRSADKPPQPEKERSGLTDMLQKEVGFNDDQVAQYKLLKDKQRAIIHPMFDDMRKAKDSLFRLLSFPETPDSVLRKAAEAIGQKQRELDLQAFTHFRKVRTLCTEDQQTRYDSMVVRMIRRMGRQPRKPEPEKVTKQ
jgi:periplasmic protein CpxP/Spy